MYAMKLRLVNPSYTHSEKKTQVPHLGANSVVKVVREVQHQETL